MGLQQLYRFRGLVKLTVLFSISLLSFSSFAQVATDSVVAPVEEAVTETKSSSQFPKDKASLEEGLSLFDGNCTACHAMDKIVVGPALAGVTERRKKDWLLKWIKDPAGMISSGDPIANKLYKEFKQQNMTAFGSLSDHQIESILSYIEDYVPVIPDVVVEGPGTTVAEPKSPIGLVLGVFIAILGVIIVLLIILIISIQKGLSANLAANANLSSDDQEVVNQKFNVLSVLKHPAFIGIIVGIVSLAGMHMFVHDGLYGVGVQLGYAPKQPINFSHKIHAGEREIDCNYCHTGVRKAKHANIPSPNICMNCHSQIKTDSKEIQIIYEALDYDPETRTYGPNIKPIEWVRIHNLPDLVYFNHSQHVKVGGIECETCHGDVAEMAVIRQYSTLTMGWCIDCHRKTAVNGNNPYYEKLLEDHEGGEMTVEDIGGTECSKCHY